MYNINMICFIMVSNTSYQCSICKVEFTHSQKFDDYSQTFSSPYNFIFWDCMCKFWISSSDISVAVWYIFGKFAIVHTVMESCTWIYTYLQYRHV